MSSLLQHLCDGKRALKHTDTLVTHADGSRYLERHSSPARAPVPQGRATGFVVDTAPDDVPALVLPHLFMGAQDCCAPDVVHGYGVLHVLSVGIEAPHQLPDVAYTYVECLDMPDTDLMHVAACCTPIISAALYSGTNILVHCNAGVSRSAAVVIAFLIQDKHMSYDDAHQLLKSVRPCIQPNSGFVRQLKTLTS